MRLIIPIILITVIILTGGFLLYLGIGSTPPSPPPSAQPTLKLYSLGEDQKTLTPPKTTFKAAEPVIFVLTFEKKPASPKLQRGEPTSFWPFVKTALAQENNQNITTELLYNNEAAKDITVETKSLEGNQFSFSLTKKDPDELRPGKYRFKVTREAGGETQNLTQDFSWGVLAINPTKSIYIPGEVAKLGIGVLNDTGRTICNAAITLEITDPNNIKTTLNETNKLITKSGQCQATSVTNVPDYLAGYKTGKAGIYRMRLTADNGNGVRSLDDSFEVRENVPFDVERTDYPMRIYPPAEYQAKITVKANQDFKGEITETVPASFTVSKIENSLKIIEGSGTKKIVWNVSLKKGDSIILSYSIKFPNISPEFYLIGPLTMKQFNNETIIFSESRQWQIASDAVSTKFMNTPDAIQDPNVFFDDDYSVGTVTYDTSQTKSGLASWKADSGAGGDEAYLGKTGILAAAGRRISIYFRITTMPTGTVMIINLYTSGGSQVGGVYLTSAGVLQLWGDFAQIGTNGSTLSTNTWYRISLSYTITSTTVNEFRLYKDGTLDISVSNATLGYTAADTLYTGWWPMGNIGANRVMHIQHIYVDDSTDLSDPGDIRVTAKLPNAENTNAFDTAVGNARSSTDYNNVNERPLSETNGWQDATPDGATAPTLADYDQSDWTVRAPGSEVTGSVTWQTGDILVVVGSTENSTFLLGTPTATGLTFSLITSAGTTGLDAPAYIWSATAGSNGSGAITVPLTGETNSGARGASVFVYRGSDGLGNTGTITGSTAKVISLTRGSANSGVVVVLGDWNAVNDTSVTSSPSGGTQRVAQYVAGAVTNFVFNWGDQGATGTTSYGITDHTGTVDMTGIVVEIKGTAATGVEAAENYGIQSAATGDVNISGYALVARTAWVWAKVGAGTATGATMFNNGTEVSVTLSTTSAVYTNIVDSTTYPTEAAAVGMRAAAGGADTYLYETGMMIAYIPVPTRVQFQGVQLKGIKIN